MENFIQYISFIYRVTVCSPYSSICNICSGDIATCPHYLGETYGGTVCSPYSSICNICGGDYATCPHSSGQAYGGTVCSPYSSICNICGGDYANCTHSLGETYGGTECSPYSGVICNICGDNYATCPHASGQTYGATLIPATPNTYHEHNSSCDYHYTTHTHTDSCPMTSNLVDRGYPGGITIPLSSSFVNNAIFPPRTLPDGTPITSENKENETTYNYYMTYIYESDKLVNGTVGTPPYTMYMGWLMDTYGQNWLERFWSGSESFVYGMGDAVSSAIDGICYVVLNPIKTAEGVAFLYRAMHPLEYPEESKILAEATQQVINNCWNDFSEGDYNKKCRMIGRGVGEIVLALVSDKGIGKATTALKDSKAFTSIMSKVGKGTLTADDAVKVLYGVAEATGSYSRSTINGMRSLSDDLGTVLAGYGSDVNYFNSLRLESSSVLTDAEKKLVRDVRNSISLTDNTLMQKVVPGSSIRSILDGNESWAKKITGCVTRAQDTKALGTLDEIYEGLRLDYSNTRFYTTDDFYGVLRFIADDANEFKIPYSPEYGGSFMFSEPFTGNGFTKSSGKVVPEYVMTGRSIPIGAEFYAVDKDGTEFLLGIYNGTKFVLP